MVQTIVIARQVTVRGKKTEERKRCFPNPLPDEATKREVAELLQKGNFRFLDGNARDIAKTQDVARLIEEVRPFLNGASAGVLAAAGV